MEKNSQTAITVLEAWQNETLDHKTYYAEEFSTLPTGFGQNDSLNLTGLIEDDKANWARFDFQMVDAPFDLLPGVNAASKEIDGSVRYYGEWSATSPASDSTEEKSGTLLIYQTFEFDERGKIISQSTFGDFTGIMTYLTSQ